MKILHVIPSLSPASGGPAEALRQLAYGYAEIGVGAEIVCQDDSGSPWLNGFSMPVHALGGRRGTYGYSRLLRDWLTANVRGFDGVVAHALWTYSSVAAAGAARGQVAYAVFTHGMLDPWFGRQYPLKQTKKWAYWPVQYPVLRDARAVLFTSELERELASRIFWPHRWTGVVVPYGANEPPRNDEAQRQAFAAALPRLEGRRFFLFLSRIHAKKGCDLLLDAFASVATGTELDLVIAGPDDDGLQEKLQVRAQRLGIAERVHWPGMLTGDAKWGALRACAAMVLPSHQENFGVVIAEALACGRPVLISRQVNLWPDIEAEKVGFVEADTVEGTRLLLTCYLQLSEAEKAAMELRALSAFRKRYSMKNCALALRDLFGG